jgi:hypothetical protein
VIALVLFFFCRTYAVGVFSLRQSGTFFVVRFFALRAKKRTTDETGSTMLPQAKKNNKGFNIRDLRMSSIFVPACRYFSRRPK